ncbi:MAG TPA: STM4015 family protein [Ktedonobacteraceae bacterium]|nr:STM4015 family protein [Ktedonobacteraceae bacterium]
MLEKQENLTWLEGKEVVDYEVGKALEKLDTRIYRLRLTYDIQGEEGSVEDWIDLLARMLQDPAVAETSGLVVGLWDYEGVVNGNNEDIVEALVAARSKLPKLRALFLGDIISEESEVSWIRQSDVSPLFNAYPELEYFGVRGGENLHLGQLRHNSLRKLVVEAGGLPREVVQEVLSSDLPALEHLELWLGDNGYGGDTTIDDLTPLFSNNLFPRLRYLGLRDSEITNEIALAVTQSPLLEQLEVLDLSLGLLDDWGAEFLVNTPAVKRLKKLDLHYNYCSQEITERLQAVLGDRVNVEDSQSPNIHRPEENRYVAVSE